MTGLPDPQEHKRPPAVAAREAIIERLKAQVPGAGAPAPAVPEPAPQEDAPLPGPAPTPRPAPPPAPAVRQTPDALLDALLAVKTPDEVFLMTMEKMPANQVLSTKVGKWSLEIRAISCTVDDTQLNFVADKRKNQALPDEVAGEYMLEYMGRAYDLKLMGVSFFPSPTSPFVLVSFLRTNEAQEPIT